MYVMGDIGNDVNTYTLSTSSPQTFSGNMTGTSAFNDVMITGVLSSTTFNGAASTTDFTISSWATFFAPTSLTIFGDYTNAGTFDANGGEVVFGNGDVTEMIGGDAVNSSWASGQFASVWSLATIGDTIYAGLGSGASDGEVWEWDGSSWTQIGGDGLNSGWASSVNEQTSALHVMNGELYAGLGSGLGDADVWKWDGSAWTQIGGDAINSSWTAGSYQYASIFTSLNGELYVGLGVAEGAAEVWQWDGSTWTKIGGDSLNSSWAATYERVFALTAQSGKIYAGLGQTAAEGEVWEWDGSAWTQIGGDSLNSGWDTSYDTVNAMTAGDGSVYAGLGWGSGDAEVWQWNGTAWTKIGGDGVNSSWSSSGRVSSLKLYGGKLYAGIGTASAGGAELWEWDGSGWTMIAGDGFNNSWADSTYEFTYSLTALNGNVYAGLGSTDGDAEVWQVPLQQTLSGTMTGDSAFNDLKILNKSQDGTTTQSVIFAAAASTTGTFTMAASTSAQFLANSTSTFTNISFNGTTSSPVWLRSSIEGTQWGINKSGTQYVSYANVQDSNACDGTSVSAGVTSYDGGNNSCWSFTDNPTISSAANQVFALNGNKTKIETITITDTVGTPTITAGNDIRIVIATGTVEMLWDTTDTRADISGTGAQKIGRNQLTYEGDGSVLVIPVKEDFAAGEYITINNISFTDFTATNTASVALSLRTGGPTDTTDDATDDKTVTIGEKLTLSNHTSGQVSDAFSVTNASDRRLFAFNLNPGTIDFTVSSVVFPLSGVHKGLEDSNFTNITLYRDLNGDKNVDAAEPTIGGSGVVSITGQTGTITFSTSFDVTTTQDYILEADYNNIKSGEHMTMTTPTFTLTSGGVAGGVSSIQHSKAGGGGGGGVTIGGDAPEGDGDVGGGDEGGGDIGEVLEPDPNRKAPAGTGQPHDEWTNGSNAYLSDGNYATSNSASQRQSYGTTSQAVPDSNQIDGIEIKLEARGTTAAGTIDVVLSWDGGTSVTTAQSTPTLSTTDTVYTLGGPADTWGRSWSPSEFSNANFRIRATSQASGNTVQIDALQVRVYHSTTGGGGGGGGDL
ncbi:hypothetical protein OAD26_00380 [bacterium]|nr:hypothetical protein [bacterium]